VEEPVKALVISQCLPPFNDSSSIQLIERVRRLPAHGYDVVIVGPETPGGVDTTLLDRLPPQITILRTPPTPYDAITWRLKQFGALGDYASWVFANAAYRLLVPDQRAGWQRSVIRLCKTRLPFRPDIVISSGGSYTAHLAALPLARHFRIPWVADLADPWSLIDMESPGGRLRAARNRRLELKTIPFADGLVVTTDSTLEAYRDFLGDTMPVAESIPVYGFDRNDFVTSEQTPVRFAESVVLSHVGVAYEANRNLIPAMNAIAEIGRRRKAPRLTFNVIGPHSQSFETAANEFGIDAHFSDRVSFEESLEWLRKADVLLIVGNAGAMQIPGKVYTYLGSEKAIVYARQRDLETDPAAKILGRFPGVIICENDARSIAGALDSLLSNFRGVTEAARERRRSGLTLEYESDRVADRFVGFVKKVAEHGR
jgi:glycosyltransferase involved in cell wall biosynthesis